MASFCSKDSYGEICHIPVICIDEWTSFKIDYHPNENNYDMPVKGQIITDSTTGNSHEFVETAQDTSGERVVLKSTIKQKGPLIPEHIHQQQDETFKVLSGKLTVLTENKVETLSQGEQLFLPKNKPHNHYNAGDEAVEYLYTVTPGMDFDYLMETLTGLAGDGKAGNGGYGLMQELMFIRYLDGKTFRADIPIGMQKFLMYTVAPIGRLLGYRAVYKKYSDIEK